MIKETIKAISRAIVGGIVGIIIGIIITYLSTLLCELVLGPGYSATKLDYFWLAVTWGSIMSCIGVYLE